MGNMKHHGIMKLVLGALILLNAYVWPKWIGIDGWVTFFGVLFVIGGLVKIFWPCNGGSCSVEAAPAAKKKKKRK